MARGRAAIRAAQRAWPYLVMGWERWQSLSPAEKERYRQRAREGAARARGGAARARELAERGRKQIGAKRPRRR